MQIQRCGARPGPARTAPPPARVAGPVPPPATFAPGQLPPSLNHAPEIPPAPSNLSAPTSSSLPQISSTTEFDLFPGATSLAQWQDSPLPTLGDAGKWDNVRKWCDLVGDWAIHPDYPAVTERRDIPSVRRSEWLDVTGDSIEELGRSLQGHLKKAWEDKDFTKLLNTRDRIAR